MSNATASMKNIQMEIAINASAEKVWSALVDNIGEWWPAEFYTGGEADRRNFRLEATPGGKMVEEWGNGGGTLWGRVIAVDPGAKLQVLGHVFPDWGGPTQWYGTWDVKESGEQSTLTFTESAIGRVSDSSMEEKDKGWKFLWATLKAHVEGDAPPVWAD